MAESTFEIVRRVLAEQLNVDEGEITLESTINEDLGADSLDAVELVMALEEEFNIIIEPDAAEGLKTVGDVVTLIDSLKA
jgi:acyl carrier protein